MLQEIKPNNQTPNKKPITQIFIENNNQKINPKNLDVRHEFEKTIRNLGSKLLYLRL